MTLRASDREGEAVELPVLLEVIVDVVVDACDMDDFLEYQPEDLEDLPLSVRGQSLEEHVPQLGQVGRDDDLGLDRVGKDETCVLIGLAVWSELAGLLGLVELRLQEQIVLLRGRHHGVEEIFEPSLLYGGGHDVAEVALVAVAL